MKFTIFVGVWTFACLVAVGIFAARNEWIFVAIWMIYGMISAWNFGLLLSMEKAKRRRKQ